MRGTLSEVIQVHQRLCQDLSEMTGMELAEISLLGAGEIKNIYALCLLKEQDGQIRELQARVEDLEERLQRMQEPQAVG